jgi:CubicO group peptidase (beta-lactamase class C family)
MRLLVLLLLLAPAAARADVVAGPYGARIDSFLTSVAELGGQGSLLVEKDGAVIVHKGYGIANRATGARAQAETPYLLGSLSKQFTAAAIYKLEEEGRLALSDTLGRWLPGVPPDKRAITLDQLVHHTAGLVYLTGGLRNDDFDTFGHATTGRVTAAWLSKDSRWKLRGSYGTAFRSPSFLDLYGQDAYYVGNPNLKPLRLPMTYSRHKSMIKPGVNRGHRLQITLGLAQQTVHTDGGDTDFFLLSHFEWEGSASRTPTNYDSGCRGSAC